MILETWSVTAQPSWPEANAAFVNAVYPAPVRHRMLMSTLAIAQRPYGDPHRGMALAETLHSWTGRGIGPNIDDTVPDPDKATVMLWSASSALGWCAAPSVRTGNGRGQVLTARPPETPGFVVDLVRDLAIAFVPPLELGRVRHLTEGLIAVTPRERWGSALRVLVESIDMYRRQGVIDFVAAHTEHHPRQPEIN